MLMLLLKYKNFVLKYFGNIEKYNDAEIDKVFKPGFAKEMPKITYARENNNLWILDNIRDSIMHGACDIDEERKCFIINNRIKL